MSADSAPVFRGYNAVRYTPCPDEFFDQQLAEMDDDELRVTLYAFRRTFGFKKTGDAISISQFLHGITTRDGRRLDRGCGLKTPRQVLAGLAKAERRGVLLSAFVCRACERPVPSEAMLSEERRQRLVNGEQRSYTVRVVPKLCPHCGGRLRGFEEKQYSLNVIDSHTGAEMPPRPRSGEPSLPPSVKSTDASGGASPSADPSVSLTDSLYRQRQTTTVIPTDTRDSPQETDQQGDVRRTMSSEVVVRETHHPTQLPLHHVSTLPGEVTPTQFWAMAMAHIGPQLERADREGWLAATALLAITSSNAADTGFTNTTLVVGLPTEQARRRCAGRARKPLTQALSALLGQPIQIEPVVTAVWLAAQHQPDVTKAGG